MTEVAGLRGLWECRRLYTEAPMRAALLDSYCDSSSDASSDVCYSCRLAVELLREFLRCL